jgi:hypothetical protein
LSISLADPDDRTITIRATTKGGKSADKEINITVKKLKAAEAPCAISVTPEHAEVALAPNSGEIPIAKYLSPLFVLPGGSKEGAYVVNYGPVPAEEALEDACKPEDINWGGKRTSLFTLTVPTATPGSQKYSWRVQNRNFYQDQGYPSVDSNTVSTTVTICGNEKLTAASATAEDIKLEAGSTVIPNAVLATYFTLDASAEGASAAC